MALVEYLPAKHTHIRTILNGVSLCW